MQATITTTIHRPSLSRYRSVLLAGVLSLTGVLILLGGTNADANVRSCVNQAAIGTPSYLPDCRGYELVTPAFKEGGRVGLSAISSSGSKLLGIARAAFANTENVEQAAMYAFTRSAGMGWATSAISPPAARFPHSTFEAVDAGINNSLWLAGESGLLGVAEDLYIDGPSGIEVIGPAHPQPAQEHATAFQHFQVVGTSRDISHIVAEIPAPSHEDVENGYSSSWPGDTTIYTLPSLYEYIVGTNGAEPRLVGVSDPEAQQGTPINAKAQLISQCGTVLGGVTPGGTTTDEAYNAMSTSGEVTYFTALAGPCSGGRGITGNGPKVAELYARVDGTHTVAISEPLWTLQRERECSSTCRESENEENGHNRSSAYFAGASEDGSKVFFTSAQPLVDGANGGGTNLYMDELGCPSYKDTCKSSEWEVQRTVLASRNTRSTEGPTVVKVVRVSEDGSQVFFVANRALTGPNREGREPVPFSSGQQPMNLYVFSTTTNTLTFIATLLTTAEREQLVHEETAELPKLLAIGKETCARDNEPTESCELRVAREHIGQLGPGGTVTLDESVWRSEDRRPAQATPNGAFLLFVSSADITADDTSKAAQLFLYDTKDATLVRVSRGTNASNGNTDIAADAPRIPEPEYQKASLANNASSALAITNDGAEIFFESEDGLVVPASFGVNNIYEWEGNGSIYLISDGSDNAVALGAPAVHLFGTDPTGENVFFSTTDPLVLEDGDSQIDVYDARVGGAAISSATQPCANNSCSESGADQAFVGLSAGSVMQSAEPGVTHHPSHRRKARRVVRKGTLKSAEKKCERLTGKHRTACLKRVRREYKISQCKRRQRSKRKSCIKQVRMISRSPIVSSYKNMQRVVRKGTGG
jgi:hypothetical protein